MMPSWSMEVGDGRTRDDKNPLARQILCLFEGSGGNPADHGSFSLVENACLDTGFCFPGESDCWSAVSLQKIRYWHFSCEVATRECGRDNT